MGKLKPFINIGPGDIIRDELEARGWSQETFADIIGITKPHVNRMINNREPITFERARLLGKAFGSTPQFWINLYTNYRLREDESETGDDVVSLKADINLHMPIRDMVKKRWFQPYRNNTAKLLEQVKSFWEMNSVDFSFMETYAKNVHFRHGNKSAYNLYYHITWLHMARKCANKYRVKTYDSKKLKNVIRNIPEYTLKENGISSFIKEINKCGVKFFVLRHLEKTYTDGAAFIDKQTNNPVIVYTGRYDRIDHFWFTVTHEIAHILKHLKGRKDKSFIDCLDDPSTETYENEANSFASDALKHDEILEEVHFKGKYPSMRPIVEAEEKLGINRSIIIGALQHHKRINYNSQITSGKEKLGDSIPGDYYAEHD